MYHAGQIWNGGICEFLEWSVDGGERACWHHCWRFEAMHQALVVVEQFGIHSGSRLSGATSKVSQQQNCSRETTIHYCSSSNMESSMGRINTHHCDNQAVVTGYCKDLAKAHMFVSSAAHNVQASFPAEPHAAFDSAYITQLFL